MSVYRVGDTMIAFTETGPRTWPVSTEPVLPPAAADQITLQGRNIMNAAGVRIVPRGPEMILASPDAITDLDIIAAMGANAVRVLIGLDTANGMTPELFAQFFDKIVEHDMIAWVSLYTWNAAANREIATAFGGGNFESLTAPPGTGVCSTATPGPCYLSVWDRQWLKDLMETYREHVIIDALQEFIDPTDPETPAGRAAWRDAAISHIQFFRSAGYTQPLAIMSNYEGRDLYAITEHAAAILAADTVLVDGQPQTLFGWQAYWSPVWAPEWYPSYQGNLLLGPGQSITATEAIDTIIPTLPYPVQCGFDNYDGDTANDYDIQMDAAARQDVPWLWWAWVGEIQAPLDGAICQDYVANSSAGFAGARTALSS